MVKLNFLISVILFFHLFLNTQLFLVLFFPASYHQTCPKNTFALFVKQPVVAGTKSPNCVCIFVDNSNFIA
ncbi:unnamed protein product [Rhizophagus irregularis]|uniref:Uncharacterized protein n=1 Tax=Rhizophagus irregularis TaxID=588596 RepID=A0A915Z1G1_9GLOM|nr:unnamed protein product [Rhizophagus irregularis]CAB5358023.1 unnamed protein product [Rhizophagus irregularis]